MNDSYSFIDNSCKFLFSVEISFLDKCPDPENVDIYKLMSYYKMDKYLHNMTGPAIYRLKDSYFDYFLYGTKVDSL